MVWLVLFIFLVQSVWSSSSFIWLTKTSPKLEGPCSFFWPYCTRLYFILEFNPAVTNGIEIQSSYDKWFSAGFMKVAILLLYYRPLSVLSYHLAHAKYFQFFFLLGRLLLFLALSYKIISNKKTSLTPKEYSFEFP